MKPNFDPIDFDWTRGEGRNPQKSIKTSLVYHWKEYIQERKRDRRLARKGDRTAKRFLRYNRRNARLRRNDGDRITRENLLRVRIYPPEVAADLRGHHGN